MKMSRRFLVMSAASFAALVVLAGPASAPAEANATAEPASRTPVTVSLTHGCDGNPTTGLRVSLPASSTVVLPTIQSCAGNNEIAWIEKDTGNRSKSIPPAPQFGVLINDRAAVTVTAESDASPSTTARMATQSNAITDEGSETSTAGQYVFIGVCAVLVGGASSLFLKYRKKSSKV